MSLTEKSASELLELQSSGTASAREIVEACCDRIEATNDTWQALLNFDRDLALKEADRIDQKRAAGETLGPLAGVPVAIKDAICERGKTATCASKLLENFVPPYDAEVIRRLKEADAILLGRANMDEFAMGSSTENSAFAQTKNPWDTKKIPGGSSGGSAACVAGRQVPLSLGSDTGGSIRQPASHCGVVGLKPTYGRVSRYGLVAFASSLDQIGPLGRTCEDTARLLSVIAGHDDRDATSANESVPDYVGALQNKDLKGVKVGIADEFFVEGLDDEVEKSVRTAIDVLKSQGAEIVKISMPYLKYALPTYYIVATAEASSNLARYDGVHYGVRAADFEDMIDMYSQTRAAFGAEVKRRIILGTYALSAGYRDAYYVKALKVRRLIYQDYAQAFEKVDMIAGPVAPTPAFELGEKSQDPLAMYLSDIFTLSTNLAGVAGLSVPCGFSNDNMPIGLQLQGPVFSEANLLRVGSSFQSQTDWHQQAPPEVS